MKALQLRRKLEANATLRAELEQDLARARNDMGQLLRDAKKVMPLKEAATHAGIDYRHAKRLTAGG